MLIVVIILKALVEIAGLALFGQGILYFLAGPKHQNNIFYKMLTTLTAPVIKATRFIAPRFILDQHIGLLAMFLLLVIWVVLTALKIKLVIQSI